MNIEKIIQLAEESRLNGDTPSAYDLLLPFMNERENSLLQLEIGLTLDAMSREVEAVPYYERALAIGLSPEKRRVALLCLGSSLRNIGEIDKSLQVLKDGMEEFPDHIGIRCFYALTQYSAGEQAKCVQTLMDAIIHLSPESVWPFAKGLAYYSGELR